MWSQYLHIRRKDKVVALFHELHPEPIYCSSKQWENIVAGITNGAETLIDDLRQHKLIVDSPDDDSHEFEEVMVALECKFNQPTILYLVTTWGCNLSCKYCPIPKFTEEYKKPTLSAEDAFAGIDLWGKHLKDKYDPDLQYFVIFYGGEPFLNREVIKSSLDYLRMKKKLSELPDRINPMIVTNGILIDDEIISLCKEHKIMVAVGLDGPKSLNDALRVDSNGAGTFDRIVAAIGLLVQNGVRTFASVSITPFNIHQISEYSTFFAELGIEKFGFNFLKGRSLLDLVGRDGLENYYRTASRGVIENARKQNKPGFEYQMEKKQIAFDQKDFFPVDCTCYGSQLVILPNGQISNCPFYRTQLGHVKKVDNNFRIWNQSIIKEWQKRLPLFYSGESKAMSGGGCAWSCKELKDDLLAIDDSSRIFSEEVLDELIWLRYERFQSSEA